MILEWLVFSDLHFQFDNTKTTMMRDKLLEFLEKRKKEYSFVLKYPEPPYFFHILHTLQMEKIKDLIVSILIQKTRELYEYCFYHSHMMMIIYV